MLFGFGGDIIFYDGAMGTMLQRNGLKPGDRPDIMNITDPDAVGNVHRMYVEAGAEIIIANTFGANARALSGTGYTPAEIISAGISIARRAAGVASGSGDASPAGGALPEGGDSDAVGASPAGGALPAGGRVKVAFDIGPLGSLLEPMGDIAFSEAYALFIEQAEAGENAGADFAAIETMSDLKELEAAVRAVKDSTSLPVLATMTFDKTGCTYLGITPESFAETAERLGAEAVGLNCSLAPEEMYATAERIAKATRLPLIVKPNAGLPDSRTGEYDIGPAEFARQMLPFIDIGAKIVGGCCGTTPEYIREIRKAFSGM